MNSDLMIRYAQLYAFLAGAFLYPTENWVEDAPLVNPILSDLNLTQTGLTLPAMTLSELQAAHRHTFGLTGSLCYETEYGLPHEFRQSQEMADICGFYRAFGFTVGGSVRERPDHVASELEFMYALMVKAAYAANHGVVEHYELCLDAQAKFLRDHLGRWIEPFDRSVALNGVEPYLSLAHLTAAFVQAHSQALAIEPQPFDPDFSCSACALAGGEHFAAERLTTERGVVL
jgi:putative dimethyl sulfoxide reductase chaperone